MLENVEDMTLGFLNRATQAWVEQEYNRAVHDELGCSPIDRVLKDKDVSRRGPDSDALRLAFSLQRTRKQRRSDGTITLHGVRFELPSRLRILDRPTLRYQRWDLSTANVYDERTDTVLARIRPLDKARNADGRRRALEIVDPHPVARNTTNPLPPLMRQYLAEYAATGMPAAYLPKDELKLQ